MAAGYVDAGQIPRSEGTIIGMMLYETISEYFLDPVHQKEFEDWKTRKDKQQIRRVK